MENGAKHSNARRTDGCLSHLANPFVVVYPCLSLILVEGAIKMGSSASPRLHMSVDTVRWVVYGRNSSYSL